MLYINVSVLYGTSEPGRNWELITTPVSQIHKQQMIKWRHFTDTIFGLCNHKLESAIIVIMQKTLLHQILVSLENDFTAW